MSSLTPRTSRSAPTGQARLARAPAEPTGAAYKVALALILLGLTACDALPWSRRDDVLLLVRSGDASGQEIAQRFAAQHRIEPGRIHALPLSLHDNALAIDAERYLTEIAAPIEAYLAEADPQQHVRLLVTTRGLPLLVEDCAAEATCRRASLDAALAQLGRTPTGKAFEQRPNPYFGAIVPFEPSDAGGLRFLVARLTAPAPPSIPENAHDARDPRTPTTRPPIPPLIEGLLEDPELALPEAGPEWLIAASHPAGARATAAGLLLDPLSEQLPRWGHRVCDVCDRPGPVGRPVAGVVLATPSLSASTSDPESRPDDPRQGEGPTLGAPGLVFALTAIPLGESHGNRNHLDATLSEWLTRGARALTLHLGDPDLALVARPLPTLRAWARGLSAAEAHFSGLPLLGGPHLFVGDPLATLPEPEQLDLLMADLDGDGIPDPEDNCPWQQNTDQRDTNGDGHGNRCDADLDGDGIVDSSDGIIYPFDARGDLETIALAARHGAYDPNLDLDGDGSVDARDLVIARLALFRPPGR